MKAIRLILAAIGTLALGPSATAKPTPKRLVPSEESGLTAARPLLRYLIATLQLPEQQALVVQQILKANPVPTPSPDELAQRLRPVLTERQFDRLLALQANTHLGNSINYLATLH